jgi:ferredoxin
MKNAIVLARYDDGDTCILPGNWDSNVYDQPDLFAAQVVWQFMLDSELVDEAETMTPVEHWSVVPFHVIVLPAGTDADDCAFWNFDMDGFEPQPVEGTSEEFKCKGCGRPELECSADPCPDVIVDRLSPWEEHPDFPAKDWDYESSNGLGLREQQRRHPRQLLGLAAHSAGEQGVRHPHRCNKCRRCFTLRHPRNWYERPPACPGCGSTSYHYDTHTRKRRLARRRQQPCHCDGYHYPHRPGGGVWCRQHPTGPDDYDWEEAYRGSGP